MSIAFLIADFLPNPFYPYNNIEWFYLFFNVLVTNYEIYFIFYELSTNTFGLTSSEKWCENELKHSNFVIYILFTL